MLTRIIDWLRSDLWRTASILLGVALFVALALALVDGDGSPAERGGDSATQTTADQGEDNDGSPAPSDPGEGGSADGTGGGFIAVKIDNAPDARPQVGIAAAPLLVEVPVEGGMTRFVAVYDDGASGIVGPIRSVRPVDADLLPVLAVNVVSTGGKPFVSQEVDAAGLQQITPLVYEFFISGGRAVPHDTFIDLGELLPLLTGSDNRSAGLPAGDLPGAAGDARLITSPVGGAEFRWEGGRYARYDDSGPFLVGTGFGSAETGLEHDVLVFMFVAQRSAGYEDGNGATVPTFDVIGSGDLLVFHKGERFEGSWARAAHADPFRFLDASGRDFGLPSGQVYLGLVPRDLDVQFSP